MNKKVFQHSKHRELWQWLGDNPGKSKGQWHRWKSNGGDIEIPSYACFACEYCLGIDNDDDCNKCPLEWTKNNYEESMCDRGGLWTQWGDIGINGNPQERTRLAYAIRDLAVKDGVVCE